MAFYSFWTLTKLSSMLGIGLDLDIVKSDAAVLTELPTNVILAEFTVFMISQL